jgi:POT family proton-dependent oligopeptide transporter
LSPIMLAREMTAAIIALAAAFFGWVLVFEHLDRIERRKLIVIMVLCAACALFWSGAELAGSALSLFADRYTERSVGAFALLGRDVFSRFEIPAGAFQSINPLLIILLAPLFSIAWLRLGRRGLNPPAAVKFALGLIFLGFGFLVMSVAAHLAANGQRVGSIWLISTYLLHTIGELCLSPVGLAAISRLAPPRLAAQMMGIWFLFVALGTLVASQLASQLDPSSVGPAAGHYIELGLLGIAAGLALGTLGPVLRRLSGPEAQ